MQRMPLSANNGLSLAYDANRKKICSLNYQHEYKIYDYKDILQSELMIDNQIISKQSTSGTVGRAVLGGILGGGIGALVGAGTASSIQNQQINSIEVKIIINDSFNPVYRLNFLNTPVKKNSPPYNMFYPRQKGGMA
jgi:hypothetical protein